MKPQLGSRSGRSGHSASAFAQGSLNHLFLLGSRLFRQLQLAFRGVCKRLPRQPTLIYGEILCFAYDDRTLDDVLQLPNITWPGIRLKQVEALFAHRLKVLSSFPGVTIDEVLDQQGNVLRSFPQRRYLNRKNVEAVKQIAAKC